MKALILAAAPGEASHRADELARGDHEVRMLDAWEDLPVGSELIAYDFVLAPLSRFDGSSYASLHVLRSDAPGIAAIAETDSETTAHRRAMLLSGADALINSDMAGDDFVTALRRHVLRRQRRYARTASDAAHVLVVDDDVQSVLPAVSEALRRGGFEVLARSGGYAALEALREHEVHVMVTDLMMPDMNGDDLCAAVLRHNAQVVPVVMTGFPTLERAVECFRVGAEDFVVKPVSPSKLRDCVERAWRRWLVGLKREHIRPAANEVRRVLVIEDSAGDAATIEQMLLQDESIFYEVRALPRIDLACAAFRAAPADVVLLDLDLPDYQGLASFAQIHAEARDAPILAVTGQSDPHVADSVMLCGAQEFLPKDGLTSELLASRIGYAIDRQGLIRRLEDLAHDVRASDMSRRSIIERNADAIIVASPVGVVLFANPAAVALFGRSVDELVGESFGFPISAEGTTTEINIHTGTKALRHGEMRVVDTVWEGARARLASIRDITDRKRAEDLQRRLIHADRLASIGQLAAGVAHEINNPLTYILGNLSLMHGELDTIGTLMDEICARADAGEQGREAPAEVAQDVQPALQAVADMREMITDNIAGTERIRRIVKSLRGFSRVEHDEIEVLNLNEVIDGASGLVQNEIRHRAQLVKDFADIPSIFADRGKLCQVFVNLLVNAAQAIEAGHAGESFITVATEAHGEMIHASVTDTGAGMEDEELDRVFDPFYTTKPREEGTGLGLSLSIEIIRHHGGTIRVSSTPGQGSCFTVVLPRETGLRAEAPQVEPEVAAEAVRNARVLIVDDEAMVRKALRRMLESEHDVVVVDGGAAALELLGTDPSFDVVLCDLMMPDVGGQEVYETLQRTNPELAGRVVFVSGGAFTDGARAFLSSAEAPHVSKPVERDDLLATVSRVIRRMGRRQVVSCVRGRPGPGSSNGATR